MNVIRLRGSACLSCAALVLAFLSVDLARGADLSNDGLPPLPDKFTKRTLSVRVVDAQNGQSIQDAKVQNSTWYMFGTQGIDPSTLPLPRTDTNGEAKVVLVIPPPEVSKQIPDFTLSLEHTNYASRTVQWHSDGGGVFGDVPEQYTVRLQRGVSIGGTVTDDKNQTLPNARVVVAAYGNTGYTVGTGEKRVQEFSQYNPGPYDPSAKSGVVTDAQGRWVINNFPPDLEAMRITVIRDDGSDVNYSSQGERFSPSRTDQPLMLTELRARTAVFKLPSGFTVKGRVVDTEDKPVAGAKVTDAYGMNPQPRGQVTTDAEGRFQFLNRRSRQCIWSVAAPGYALANEVVAMKPDMPEMVVRLQPAKPAVLRITLANGKPAPGVIVQVAQWRNEGMYVNFKGNTGPDGLLIWSNAPMQAVRAMVSAPGQNMRFTTMQAGHEQNVALTDRPQDEFRVSIRATDAKRRQALPAFDVLIDKNFMTQFAPWIQGSNGLAQGTLRLSDFRPGTYPQVRVRLSASGFVPKDSESIDLNDGDQEIVLALDPDVPIKGVVHLPDGAPGEGVYLLVNRQPGQLFLNQTFQRGPVKPPSWGNFLKVQAGPEGTYALEGLDATAVVVAMHESGYAEIAAKELKTNANLTLHPWERLEGVLKIGNDPAKAGQRIGLTTTGVRAGALGIHFDASTDAEGHFTFDKLPAGSYTLFRYLDSKPGTIVFSHRQIVDVAPGKPALVQMGGRGVRVEGKVRPSGYADLDWTVNRHTLTAKPAPNNSQANGAVAWEDFVRRADFEAANRGIVSGMAPEKQYLLTFDKDGSFFADDVDPGEYILQIKVTEPPPRERSWMEDGKLIGAMSTNIVVPPPQGAPVSTLEIGPYVLPLSSINSGAPMPTFQARMPDGKAIELGGKKDTPQAILFWAPWSARSTEALGQFSKSAGGGTGLRLSAVAVALDDEPTQITRSAQAAAWKGTLAMLSGADLLKAFAAQPIDEVPLLVIVDSNGQLITKTSNMARLSTAVSEALAGSKSNP